MSQRHGVRRPAAALAVFAAAMSIAVSAGAGSLTGAILDVGAEAVLVDIAQIPASSGSPPLARINVMREAPDGSGRLFVNDLNGPLHVIDGGVISTYMDFTLLLPALKISPGLASGLVSFAFHPEFASNGLFYTVHSEYVGSTPPNLSPALPTTIDQHSVLMEWNATVPGANAFAGTSRELLRIGAPYRIHNMGEIVFNPAANPSDPDYGLLYIGAGDYSSVFVGEPEQLQRLDSPLGAILRIDPLGGPFLRGGTTFNYGIPATNPFANDPDPTVLGEIYAYGFRNAHRIHWDAGGQNVGPYVSDIGREHIEEVNLLVSGGNYGWPVREGSYEIDVLDDPDVVFERSEDGPYEYPLVQYDHAEGRAIAGGVVFRGDPSSPLEGRFVFGDIVNGRIFYADTADLLAADDGDPDTTAQIYEVGLIHEGQTRTLLEIVADALGEPTLGRVDLRFGMDSGGQIYLTTKQDGFIRSFTPVPEPGGVISIVAGALLLAALERRRRLAMGN